MIRGGEIKLLSKMSAACTSKHEFFPRLHSTRIFPKIAQYTNFSQDGIIYEFFPRLYNMGVWFLSSTRIEHWHLSTLGGPASLVGGSPRQEVSNPYWDVVHIV